MNQDPDLLVVRKIAAHADLAGRSVLEIGCGEGRLTAALAALARRLAAAEPDLPLLSVAAAKMVGVDFCAASGQALPFADHAFDRVLFTLSLHHQDGRRALAEAGRVLRPQGRVVVIEPVNDGEIEQVCNLFHDEEKALQGATAALEGCGLEPESAEVFEVPWIFDDRQDLLDYLFRFSGRACDTGRVRRVDVFLEDRRAAAPIVLMDRLKLVCLKKR